METKEMPLVSVVVPCYNHEKYVKETIESIINQTYKNIELIVIDDGSKDNSVNIIDNLQKEYNFTFIHRANKGLSSTLNEAISLSKGKYITVCASDDMYLYNKITTQVEFMENNPNLGMCFGKVIVFDDFSNEKFLDIPNTKGGWIFNDLIVNNFFIPAISVLIKKEVLNKVGLFDESLWVEDWDMWLRISNKYEVGFINEYFAYYRQHDSNSSKQGWKLYKAKKQALNKWNNLDNYNYILNIWKIKWFRSLSRDFKSEAKKYLFFAIKNFYRKDVVIGLIKYFFLKERK